MLRSIGHTALLTSLVLGAFQMPLMAMDARVKVEPSAQVEKCTTCLEEIIDGSLTLSCGHVLHKSCLESQFKTLDQEGAQIFCGQCRKPISWGDARKLDLSHKPEDSLEKLHEILMTRLSSSNFEQFKEALKTTADSVDFEEVFGEQYRPQVTEFLEALTIHAARDYETLANNYNEVTPLSAKDIILFLQNVMDHYKITTEDVIQLREAIGRTGEKGQFLLQALGPYFNELEKLVTALSPTSGPWATFISLFKKKQPEELSPLFERIEEKELHDIIRRFLRMMFFVSAHLEPTNNLQNNNNDQEFVIGKVTHQLFLELLCSCYLILSDNNQDKTLQSLCLSLTATLGQDFPYVFVQSFDACTRYLYGHHCHEIAFDATLSSITAAAHFHNLPVQQAPQLLGNYLLTIKKLSYLKATVVLMSIAFLIHHLPLKKAHVSSHRKMKRLVDTLFDYCVILVSHSIKSKPGAGRSLTANIGSYAAHQYIPSWYSKKLELFFKSNSHTDKQFDRIDYYLNLALYCYMRISNLNNDKVNHFTKLMYFMTLRYAADTVAQVIMPRLYPTEEETLPEASLRTRGQT